jgi:hypothetical protein
MICVFPNFSLSRKTEQYESTELDTLLTTGRSLASDTVWGERQLEGVGRNLRSVIFAILGWSTQRMEEGAQFPINGIGD